MKKTLATIIVAAVLAGGCSTARPAAVVPDDPPEVAAPPPEIIVGVCMNIATVKKCRSPRKSRMKIGGDRHCCITSEGQPIEVC